MALRDAWLIDGTLEPTEFQGFSEDRFPLELAERVIEIFTRPGDWMLDPFAGLGTSLIAATKLGRNAVGFEPNAARASYAASKIALPSRIIPREIQDMGNEAFPPFALIFTSPPYIMVNLEDDPWGSTYFQDMQDIFAKLTHLLSPGGKIIVEVSNINAEDGFRPLISQLGEALRQVLTQTGEIIRVNTSGAPAGPGTTYSSLLLFDRPT